MVENVFSYVLERGKAARVFFFACAYCSKMTFSAADTWLKAEADALRWGWIKRPSSTPKSPFVWCCYACAKESHHAV